MKEEKKKIDTVDLIDTPLNKCVHSSRRNDSDP